MKLFSTFLALGFALSASVAAHADTIDLFNYQATLTYGYTSTGTVTIDVTTGVIESLNIGVSKGSTLYDTFTNIVSQSTASFNLYISTSRDAYNETYPYLSLDLPQRDLVKYNGGPVCSENDPCQSDSRITGGPTGSQTVASGTLTLVSTPPVAATPEPSSLALLGTGLLSVAGVARRRFLRA